MIYDGKCRVCLGSVAWLKKRDRNGILQFSPLQKTEVLIVYGIPPEEALLEMQAMIDGVRYCGAEAVIRVISCLPGYRWLRIGLRWQWFMRLASFLYGQIAKRRYWFGKIRT